MSFSFWLILLDMIISRSIHIAANGNISFLCPSSIHRILKNTGLRSSLVSQQVKDPVLSLPWYEFDPWPGNFHLLWGWWKKYWLVIRKNISRKLLMRKKNCFIRTRRRCNTLGQLVFATLDWWRIVAVYLSV